MEWIDAKLQPPEKNGKYLLAVASQVSMWDDRAAWWYVVADFKEGRWFEDYDYTMTDVTKDARFYMPIVAPPGEPK